MARRRQHGLELLIGLSALISVGCHQPVGATHCIELDRASDFTGRFEHVMEAEDGTRSAPSEMFWSQQEDLLYGLDPRGGVRLVFGVESWIEAHEDPNAECGLVVDYETERSFTTRSHVRVDWGEELAGAGAELLGGDVEPWPLYAGDDRAWEERRPARVRDSDGRLRRLTVWAQYRRLTDGVVLAVRHELTRSD